MTAELLIGVRVLAECLLLWGAARHLGVHGLRIMSIVNMALIGFFAAKLVTVFGHTTNTGNTMYAAVMLSQAMVYERYGYDEAVRSIRLIFNAMIAVLILSQLIALQAPIEGDRAGELITQLLQPQPRIMAASFSAFFLAQFLFVLIYHRLAKRGLMMRYVLNATVCQAVDSVVFFSLAFGGILPWIAIAEMVAVGAALKSAIAVVTVPMLLLKVEPSPA